MPCGEIGTFSTYSSLLEAQPFVSFPYVSIKTPVLARYSTVMVNVVHEPIDDEQAGMHIWSSADFCGFGLEQGSSTRGPRAACGPRASFVRPGKCISHNTMRYEY